MTAHDIEPVVAARHAGRLLTESADALDQLMAVRTSCSAFTADTVDRQTIRDILHAAQMTASWCNSQSWEVSITSGACTRRLRDALTAAAAGGRSENPDMPFPREYRGVHRDRRRESGYAMGVARGDHERRQEQSLRNLAFFGAPHVAIFHVDEALGVRPGQVVNV